MDSKEKRNEFNSLRQLMAQSSGIPVDDLTKIQNTVIFAHFATIASGFVCIDRNRETLEFPANWNEDFEGVYKFTYRTVKEPHEVYQFRFMDSGEGGGKVMVSFAKEDGDQLHQIELQLDQGHFEEALTAYKKKVQGSVNPKEEKKAENKSNPLQVRRLQPVWRQPMTQPGRNPMGIQPPSPYNPFEVPFGRQEYIGPNSDLFEGRQPMNPSMRRPPGARFDPIDPFGNESLEQPGGHDFAGFDQFGRPIGKKGNNPFSGGNPYTRGGGGDPFGGGGFY